LIGIPSIAVAIRRYETNGTHQGFSVKRTPRGLGLFTRKRISRGKLVVEYTGNLLPSEEAYRKGGRYLFEVNSRWIIDGAGRENISRYINHSCRPNCEPRTRGMRVLIYARRNIDAGEELSYDYGKEYFDDLIKPKGCRCDHCLGQGGRRRRKR
jgi:SET domain-containing protein